MLVPVVFVLRSNGFHQFERQVPIADRLLIGDSGKLWREGGIGGARRLAVGTSERHDRLEPESERLGFAQVAVRRFRFVVGDHHFVAHHGPQIVGRPVVQHDFVVAD